jgi:hypothetical protein
MAKVRGRERPFSPQVHFFSSEKKMSGFSFSWSTSIEALQQRVLRECSEDSMREALDAFAHHGGPRAGEDLHAEGTPELMLLHLQTCEEEASVGLLDEEYFSEIVAQNSDILGTHPALLSNVERTFNEFGHWVKEKLDSLQTLEAKALHSMEALQQRKVSGLLDAEEREDECQQSGDPFQAIQIAFMSSRADIIRKAKSGFESYMQQEIKKIKDRSASSRSSKTKKAGKLPPEATDAMKSWLVNHFDYP